MPSLYGDKFDFADREAVEEADVIAYSIGICSASVCVRKGLGRPDIETWMNLFHSTGIGSMWEITDDNFSNGDPNPCSCNIYPDSREHYLLHC